ncbi:MAG TPA: hypothetical protein PKJ39_02850 [Caldisericia bacterium]|nr:hypothetical protein [Caldisericia bacterium]HQL66979.1 hypothetical protein [Caldisericia bacterium]HQN49165.1 hypothetical protein [Caldisericia bacterium]
MKLNYKKIILWILFIIVLINLISTPRIFEISYELRDTYMKSENILPKLISEFYDFFILLIKEISYQPLIYVGIPNFFAIWVIYLLFPILQLIPKNFMILFIILWLTLNFALIIYLYKKLNIPKITFVKIIIYPILLNCGLFMILLEHVIPSISYLIYLLLGISMIVYPLYLIASWLSKLKPIK